VRKTSRFKTLRDYVDAQPRQKTQSDIAADLGLVPSQLSMYLNGVRRPSRDVALRISRQCGIPLEGLLDPEERRTA
jgi:transcriptional regulator with XRE-family HTH domain